MKVSVVIPAYNEEHHIGACLTSLNLQKEKADEIVVVDNNSTDQTASIAKKMGARVVPEPKQGMIYARNTGFNSATGDILARTDADTILPPDWIERIKKDFQTHDIAGVSGPAEFGSPFLLGVVKLMFVANRMLLHHDSLYGPNFAIRATAWEKIHDKVCLDERLVHEDVDMGIHIAQVGKIYYDPQLIVKTSARRLKNPASLLGDYLPKWRTTLQQHSYR